MVTAAADHLHWRWRAACLGVDMNVFYPPRFDGAPVNRALAFCAACPVVAECLDLALRTADEWGVYGGKTPAERMAIRRERGMVTPGPRPTLQPCGTEGGYRRHRRAGEPACERCRAATVAASHDRKARRAARGRGEVA